MQNELIHGPSDVIVCSSLLTDRCIFYFGEFLTGDEETLTTLFISRVWCFSVLVMSTKGQYIVCVFAAKLCNKTYFYHTQNVLWNAISSWCILVYSRLFGRFWLCVTSLINLKILAVLKTQFRVYWLQLRMVIYKQWQDVLRREWLQFYHNVWDGCCTSLLFMPSVHDYRSRISLCTSFSEVDIWR